MPDIETEVVDINNLNAVYRRRGLVFATHHVGEVQEPILRMLGVNCQSSEKEVYNGLFMFQVQNMMQFYIPEVVAVEQIIGEDEKMSDKVFEEFEKLKTKEEKKEQLYNHFNR